MNNFSIKSIVFDLDGTLVDSQLDFDKMRADIGIPRREPILEYIETQDDEFKKHAEEIIHKHELIGLEVAKIIRDADEFLNELKSLNIPTAILTRNSKFVTDRTIEKFNWSFDKVLTRDCAPAKPDPAGLFSTAQELGLELANMLYIGDHDFDLQTARNAGCIAGLLLQDYNKKLVPKADIAIEQFLELMPLFE